MKNETIRRMLCTVALLTAGCVSYARPLAEVSLFVTTRGEATQMLTPGAEERRCHWRAAWREGGEPARSALAALAATTDEADVLVDTSISTRTTFLGPFIRECATVRTSLARRIRTILLPSVGGEHGAHHGHAAP